MKDDKRLKRKVRNSYIVSTVSITLVLFLLGSVGYLMVAALKVADTLQESIAVTVELKNGLSEAQKETISKRLTAEEMVATIAYSAKEEKAEEEEFRKMFGSSFEEILPENPLLDSFELTLTSASSDKELLDSFIAAAGRIEGVDRVSYPALMAERLHATVNKIRLVLLLFGGALLLFLPPQDTRDELAAFCRAAQSISTPLTTLLSVSGTLFPLLSEAEDPAVQQNLAVLNRACYQLLRASENLTDLSYVQHGRLPLSLEKTDLTDFLDGLAQRADELCRQMGLALEADLPQAPIFVWIDRRQVRRALLALLSNAVKFSAPGGTLHLTLTRHGRRAVIRLSDSGEGMDAEILCSAFHRYARPEVPEDSRFGAGFSLPVVQAIMQAHGGSLLLQSQRGGGTDALLTLPAGGPTDRTLLKSPRISVDRSGGFVPELVELSDVLPPQVFDVRNFL